MPPAKDPLLKAGKAYFNEYDQTGAFSVVRKGLKIYRTECKMGSGQYTETVSKPKPKRTVKPESPRRDTTLDMVEPFTDLDVSTYSQYLALQKERASLSHDVSHPAPLPPSPLPLTPSRPPRMLASLGSRRRASSGAWIGSRRRCCARPTR